MRLHGQFDKSGDAYLYDIADGISGIHRSVYGSAIDNPARLS